MKRLLTLLTLLLFLSGCAGNAPVHESGKVIIALIDTGVSTAAIRAECLLPGHNYTAEDADTEDRINHGTAVASVIVGCESAGVQGLAADDCLIVPLVVADEGDSSISPQTLAQAIRDSVDIYGADIINASLGIRRDVPELADAVAYAEKKGVLVIAAVGNSDDSESLYYPAAYETVISVGSHDETMRVSRFSQKNGTADLLAPGEDIRLASRDGRVYGARGTSYATGYVSAAAAKILACSPSLKPQALRELLFSTARDIGDPGRDDDSGWGILDLDKALTSLAK
ncbi:MAG: hypothetical protein E7463_08860 [Ruminococcaceae bacterium]|nr:hypothetical protein [Oscillospiraceae bacterium]